MRVAVPILLLAAMVALAGCSGGSDPSASTTPSAPTAPVQDPPQPLVWNGLGMNPGLGCFVPQSEDGGAYFFFDQDLAGRWAYKATSTTLGVTLTTEWWIGDSNQIAMAGDQGTIPAGSDNVAVCPSLPGVPADFTLVLYDPAHPPA